MAPTNDIVVFGIASSGVVDQWDGHFTPAGILLRWFMHPELGYPDLGFEVYRASVPDARSLPFDDLNVQFIEGTPTWTYAGTVTLSQPAGLHFEPSGLPGWWRLRVAPGGDPVTLKFSSPAWLVNVHAATGMLTVVGKVAGVPVREQSLAWPDTILSWRTRGIEELEISGDGSVSLIAFHLLDDPASWQLLAHRCLPVIDPAYRCGPQPPGTEADEARSRLPAKVAGEWKTRFGDAFASLLPALRRLATRAAPLGIPGAQGHPDVRLTGDEQTIIALSALDPHGARILGLAFDDPLGGALDGREYIYKIVGRWLAELIEVKFALNRADIRRLQSKYGVAIELDDRERSEEIVIRFRAPVFDFSVQLELPEPVAWVAKDGAGASDSGKIERSPLSLPQVQELRLRPGSPIQPDHPIYMSWRSTVERFGLLPGIVAIEPGPPAGPSSLTVAVAPADSPSALATADLDWPIKINPDDSIPEGEPISYQLGRRHLGTDPTVPTPDPATTVRADLLYEGAPVIVSAAVAQEPFGQRVLHTDRSGGAGLSAGRWGWWVRGVDLFGRASAPSPWVQAAVLDVAPPPAPIMVEAEWVQRNLPEATVGVLGRSTEGARWLQRSQADAGLIASWTYGPDQAELRPDVDGFRLLMRRPAGVAGAPAGALQYSDLWPAPIASFGPMAIRSDGTVSAAPSANPTFAVTLSSIQTLPAAPAAKATDPIRSSCLTNLTLDGASGVFVGGTLTIGATSFPVVASGDGTNLAIVVQHSAALAPVAGPAQLSAASTSRLAEITTNLPALTPPAGLRARAGVLVVGTAAGARRLQVLRAGGGVLLCRGDGAGIAIGEVAAWFPVWSVSLDDAGFGPATSDTVPVAHAQVAVCAVRRIKDGGLASTPSGPLTVTAVDLTIPIEPVPNAITFDPAATCARLASRADWYGKSRFLLSWAAQTHRSFTVYRALGDEINRLDRIEHDKGGRRAQGFPQAADWPAGVYADTARRSRVLAELAAVTAAHTITNPDVRTAALDAAYDAMTIDTQMMLARQGYAWPAFGALFGEPTKASSFEDVLDGRSHGHWFYRVTSRTAAGMESPPCEPTPPICCPDVVPPAVPLAHMALAGAGSVKLRWLASPDADLHHYEVYAARDAEAGAELESMTPTVVHTPTSHQGGLVIQLPVTRPPGEWCFWIVAVDTSGNRSAPSTMLRGRSLVPPPVPPVWVSATREPAVAPTHVVLSWSHATDSRLACLVERRPATGGFWASLSGWLPRGVYQYKDRPSVLDGAWEYRLRIRDHLGQVADTLPTINLQAL
ncbi:MAG TPA: hypothetical protein VNO30_10805 [Kofleriaceae bacterium]|nr:hypothetical protein [Kofleriaceae bacterium]